MVAIEFAKDRFAISLTPWVYPAANVAQYCAFKKASPHYAHDVREFSSRAAALVEPPRRLIG
jgi:hypothetical protein